VRIYIYQAKPEVTRREYKSSLGSYNFDQQQQQQQRQRRNNSRKKKGSV